MTQYAALKACTSLTDIAQLLNYKPSSMAYILYKIQDKNKYTKFEVSKRSGGKRVISAPILELKLMQRKLADLLQNCLNEINEAQGYKNQYSHGFIKGRSIFTNAKNHRKRRWVFNVDLENFFGTINFGRVRGYFIKDRRFELDPKVATIIAQIACHENALPQGSPCSPIIANIIGHMLDIHLAKLADACGCYYSRYADDITFSTNKRDFPSSIALRDGNDGSEVWKPGSGLKRLVEHSRFTINPVKTRMQYKNSRQDVTGLIVNEKINVKVEYRRLVRAMVNRLLTQGHYERTMPMLDETGNVVLKKMPGTTDELHGMLGFIDGVDKYNKTISLPGGGKVRDDKKRASSEEKRTRPSPTGKDQLYRRFLMYKEFFAAPRPIILCEGETDNVYLVHAIRRLAADYPLLASVGKDEIKLLPRLYKYVDTSTGRILGLNNGGTGDLGALVRNYCSEIPKFIRPDNQHPFVLLIDNDKGAVGDGKPISVSRKITGKDIDKNAPFSHIAGNLYIVATPLIGDAKESMIEDFFEQTTRDIPFEGKTFCAGNKMDRTKNFGKKVFAHKIVRPKEAEIEFAGFRPLLDNIVLAFEHFYAEHPRAANCGK